MEEYEVAVLGAGPAGLAAGLAAHQVGAKTVIIEREKRPGGILKQCIHDGFGLINFKQRLSGPEYAERYLKMVINAKIPILTSTFVMRIDKTGGPFLLQLVNAEKGAFTLQAKALVLATGCRERTAKQIAIHGTRPAGIYTAGTAQYFVNIMGYLPCQKCVILGSGDIGLIMARRLTLEGAEVLGVYEVKPEPSGLSRNVTQCLDDYGIPLYLSYTVTKVMGDDRVEAVEIAQVDDQLQVLSGTARIVQCDGLILSVGLTPENELAEALGVQMDTATKGPLVDQNFMTTVKGVFSCGNALHVNDLVDYVSESGQYAGEQAATFVREVKDFDRKFGKINFSAEDFLYVVPQYFNVQSISKKAVLYFRTRKTRGLVRIQVKLNGEVLCNKKYLKLKSAEMERLVIDLANYPLGHDSKLNVEMLEGEA